MRQFVVCATGRVRCTICEEPFVLSSRYPLVTIFHKLKKHCGHYESERCEPRTQAHLERLRLLATESHASPDAPNSLARAPIVSDAAPTGGDASSQQRADESSSDGEAESMGGGELTEPEPWAAETPAFPPVADIYDWLQSDDPDVLSRGIALIGSLPLDEELRHQLKLALTEKSALRLRLMSSENSNRRLRSERDDARRRASAPLPPPHCAPTPPKPPPQPCAAPVPPPPQPQRRSTPVTPAAPISSARTYKLSDSRLDNYKGETLDLRREETRRLKLWVARPSKPAEMEAARALLKQGFPGWEEKSTVNGIINSTGHASDVYKTVRFVCLSDVTAPLEPVSVAAVITPGAFYRKTDLLRVRLLSTRRNEQRRGLGRFLLQNLARLGAARGMPRTFVEAVEGNDVFWERCGFWRVEGAARKRLEAVIDQLSEQPLFPNIIVVQAPASVEFHVNLFQLREGSKVIFESSGPKEERIQGTIIDLDLSAPSCTLQTSDPEPIIFTDDEVFDIRPVGTRSSSPPPLSEPCAICLSEIAEEPHVLQCGHAFHAACLQELGEKGPRLAAPTRRGRQVACPSCRKITHAQITR